MDNNVTEAKKRKRPIDIIKSVLVIIVVVIAVFMMIFTIVSSATFDRKDRNLFGYKFFVVLSDSMSKTDFDAGDLIFSKEVDPATLVVGDIITYQSTNMENYGEIVTHKIREITTDAEGNPGFITYGTTTDVNDTNVVTYSFVLGKYQGRVPNVGYFFQFLKTTPGYIVCIFIPFLILICVQGFNSIRLFKQYKSEQMAALEAKRAEEQEKLAEERERLEAEREQSRKMLEELQRLQAQLAANQGAPAPESETPAAEATAEATVEAPAADTEE